MIYALKAGYGRKGAKIGSRDGESRSCLRRTCWRSGGGRWAELAEFHVIKTVTFSDSRLKHCLSTDNAIDVC